MYKRLGLDFFIQQNVAVLASSLLGKVLCTKQKGLFTSAMIVETEAYQGPEDKGSHAFRNRRTQRTETMFNRGGFAYVYLCYGIHHLFNVVTGPEDVPHAVLIRAIQPIEGVELMMKRRKMLKILPKLTAGPGTLSQALGITTAMTGTDMLSPNSPVWIEDRQYQIRPEQIMSGPRIGIDYAEDWIDRPLRFWIKDSIWVSRQR